MKFQYLTKTATAPKPSWSNRDTVMFHYFNPNGVYAEKIKLDAEIRKLVELGKCKTGALIAYGSLDDYFERELSRLVDMKRVTLSDAFFTIMGMQKRNKKVMEFIAEVSAV
jgi:hypothetical protein